MVSGPLDSNIGFNHHNIQVMMKYTNYEWTLRPVWKKAYLVKNKKFLLKI